LKRFTKDFAVLDPQVGFTYSADVVSLTFFRALWVPAKSKQYFHWLTFDRQTVVDVSRLDINEGARRNKQCAGCRHFPSPSRTPNFPLSLPLSSACHAGYFDDDLHALSPLKVSKENTFTHEIKF